MAATNHTQYYNLPQFSSSDIPSWNDINDAFLTIDHVLHNMASSSGITPADAQILIDNSLEGFIKHDSTNGTGITSNEYSHLLINTNI